MTSESPSLAWVLVSGVPRHVSDFADLTPRRRPPAQCPQCGRRVSLKLGTVRRHHAAHEPGWSCPATRAETALHINCKLSLAASLRRAAGRDAVLSIVERCAGARDEACYEQRVSEWLRNWDAVSVELLVGEDGERRPDIVLERAGAPVGAIEILVSNPVSPEKTRALQALGVPWIEVAGTEALATRNQWTPDQPLDVVRAGNDDAWRCAHHTSLYHATLAAQEAQRGAARDAQRHSSILRAARVVDVYHDGGVRERVIYRVTEQLTDGRVQSVRLQRGGVEVVSILVSAVDDVRGHAWPLLRTALTADLDQLSRGPGSFTDSPMRWAKGDAAENLVDEALMDRVGLDPTPLATRFPRRWFYAPAQRRWFLPADMRGVRWDREPLDAFAAHPAWSKHRATIGERPAPEGSWSTPVFGSPPIAAMFRSCVQSVSREPDDAIGVVEVAPAGASAGGSRRVIVVVERPVSDAAIESLATRLGREAADVVWLSSPRHWIPALAPLAWAPAGRDWSGRGGVVIDGLGVFKADQFARAWATGDRRVTAAMIQERMRGRVERLAESFRGVERAPNLT